MSDRAAIDRLLSDPTAKGEIAGVVAVAGTASGEIYAGAAGRRDLSKPEPMTVDTVFWIASMTKAIVSAAAMQMVEQGKVGLDQDLGGILPDLANRPVLEGWDADGKPRLRPAKGAITLRQLLTHTAGLCYEIWNADIARDQQ
ncbi:MAG: beta-lactamase family protein, partial [Rhodospirillales bacterium]|nr:beta-lactamase family protein [Rhodospirillales bacterium]